VSGSVRGDPHIGARPHDLAVADAGVVETRMIWRAAWLSPEVANLSFLRAAARGARRGRVPRKLLDRRRAAKLASPSSGRNRAASARRRKAR